MTVVFMCNYCHELKPVRDITRLHLNITYDFRGNRMCNDCKNENAPDSFGVNYYSGVVPQLEKVLNHRKKER